MEEAIASFMIVTIVVLFVVPGFAKVLDKNRNKKIYNKK